MPIGSQVVIKGLRVFLVDERNWSHLLLGCDLLGAMRLLPWQVLMDKIMKSDLTISGVAQSVQVLRNPPKISRVPYKEPIRKTRRTQYFDHAYVCKASHGSDVVDLKAKTSLQLIEEKLLTDLGKLQDREKLCKELMKWIPEVYDKVVIPGQKAKKLTDGNRSLFIKKIEDEDSYYYVELNEVDRLKLWIPPPGALSRSFCP